MSRISAFDHIENKHTLYRGKGCMKKFCESLREHKKIIIDFEKRRILPLMKEELKSHQDVKNVIFVEKEASLNKRSKSINYWKVKNRYKEVNKEAQYILFVV